MFDFISEMKSIWIYDFLSYVQKKVEIYVAAYEKIAIVIMSKNSLLVKIV